MIRKRYPAGVSRRWRVTVTTRDGFSLIEHHVCEDLKEVQGVCTIARHRNLSDKILIHPPADGQVYSWD